MDPSPIRQSAVGTMPFEERGRETTMQDPETLHRRYLLDPRPMHLIRWLESLLQASRFEDVVRAAETETARWPDYAPLRIVLARAYMGLGRWDLARQHLEEVLRQDAAHLRAWEALVETYAALGQWDDVATCLENLEMLGGEPEKLRLWRQRLAEHRPLTSAPPEVPPPAPPRPVEEVEAPSPSPPTVPVAGEEVPAHPPSPESLPEPLPAFPTAQDVVHPSPSPRGVRPAGWVLAGAGWPTWADAWADAQPAGPFFRRQRPRIREVSPEDPGWYNLAVYWSHLSPKGEGDEA